MRDYPDKGDWKQTIDGWPGYKTTWPVDVPKP